ncbi:uncharacterized protein BP5553_08645 [Venustampulla echinocandica]|uniref:Uncharacterized protein n=1 Tax=Venustampulla echinocandica TaxID=2656787 RepID=A0A370TET9_9HELO|nr:uncharacterized protein BP5553_08645 [Venustampulla echinocandica]RDL33206.1 hypothetical protein BP5553_08645 [Venustampulla echinocandica]
MIAHTPAICPSMAKQAILDRPHHSRRRNRKNGKISPHLKTHRIRSRSSPEEKPEMEAHAEGALRGMEAMQSIHDAIGDLFPEKGCVRTDLDEESLNALGQMKEQVMDESAKNKEERAVWARMWPFGT